MTGSEPSPEATPVDPQQLRQLLAAAFVRVMGDNSLHAKTLGLLVARVNVVLDQLDFLRKLSMAAELPEWYRTSGAWLVADRIGADVSLLAIALRDALQADTPHPITAVH